MTDAVEAVQAAIEKDRDFVIELTREIVAIPSVNPKFVQDPAQNRETDVQNVIQGHLDAAGFSTERWDVFPDRPNVVGDWQGSEDKSLILCGHIDVVPVGDASAWDRDPFSADIADGRIWGRGAVDMKSGVAACVAAARALRDVGVELEGRLSIHSVVDEEAGGFGAMDAVKRGKLAKRAIIAEPTWGDVIAAEGGLTWVRVTIFGKQAHAGWRFNEIWPQPHEDGRLEPGVNAIELANRFPQCPARFRSCSLPFALASIDAAGAGHDQPRCYPGRCRHGVRRRQSGRDDERCKAQTTDLIPDVVTIDLDYKFMPQENFEDVKTEFEAFVHHFAATDPWMRDNPPKILWDLFDRQFSADEHADRSSDDGNAHEARRRSADQGTARQGL